MTRLARWGASALGVGAPVASFFTDYSPPLFPGVSFFTAGLAAAIWGVISLKRRGASDNRFVRGAKTSMAVGIVLIVIYILLFQFTTVGVSEENGTRIQIGFGTASWSLTKAGRDWQTFRPAMTPFDMLNAESFKPDSARIIWKTWSIYTAGACLIALYLAGFVLWTNGCARLGIKNPTDGATPDRHEHPPI
jgi:hypothetical protein